MDDSKHQHITTRPSSNKVIQPEFNRRHPFLHHLHSSPLSHHCPIHPTFSIKMPTLATASLDSDEEDDEFVPEVPKKRTAKGKTGPRGTGAKRARTDEADSQSESESDTEDEDEDLELEQGEAKKLRLEQEEAEEERRKKEAEENYKNLLEGEDEPAHTSTAPKKRMVEVRRPRMFAGQII
jgi:hypothetical protein